MAIYVSLSASPPHFSTPVGMSLILTSANPETPHLPQAKDLPVQCCWSLCETLDWDAMTSEDLTQSLSPPPPPPPLPSLPASCSKSGTLLIRSKALLSGEF